ncbi:MAG: glycoside hydrolase family 19 protein [Flavobacterium sp.]|uniref:glycoside hydrolase family 19 protein n=1 Tax=Flavobacterium sp. TaxID=239 RepID=UPI00261FBC7F|nr:glycoside hydrolase family 19 protein [Flavobacterium sp.]MDD5150421.1 glycoside hydrolase family 19 protein [Flavobacterium sp.]
MLEKFITLLPKTIYNDLDYIGRKFEINTTLRLCHFLSQCYHESGGFIHVVENLNYSSDGLLQIFPKYFNTNNVKDYSRNPEKIANLVYANRLGNGNVFTGDGYRYRGRGYIQLTGKSNYTEFNKIVTDNVILNPDLVASKYPITVSAWFWQKTGLNQVADFGSNDQVITTITKKINGGTNGLTSRIAAFHRFYDRVK